MLSTNYNYSLAGRSANELSIDYAQLVVGEASPWRIDIDARLPMARYANNFGMMQG